MLFGADPRHPLPAFCLGLVRLAARIAPASERRTWGAEWKAEVTHRWAAMEGRPIRLRGALDLIARSSGAFVHAVWLRGQEWRYDMVSQDVRYAVRGLVKRPSFSAILVGTIALGVGATTAVFSVLYAVVLRPLPYHESHRLAMVWEHNLERSNPTNVVSGANYVTWTEESGSFEGLAAVTWYTSTLTGTDEPERVGVVATTANLWSLLGISAVHGRVFLPEEDLGAADVTPVLLSHGFWQRRFGGDPNVVNSQITLNGFPQTVVGILPAGFEVDLPYSFNSTGTQDIWVPQSFSWEEVRGARGRWLQVVARLADGVTLERAQGEMSALAGRLEMEFPQYQSGWTVNVVPMQRQVAGEARTPVIVLFGAVFLVLLIACANVANLLMARASSREQEIAVRTALGANRLRLVRQLLTESSILAVLGGGFGILLALAAVRWLVALGPDLPRVQEVSLNGTVVAFAIGVALVTGLLFGLLPALRASRPDLSGALKEGGARGGSGRGLTRLRSSLVAAEIALSLMLLVGTGLLIRSFANMLETGVGFETEGVLSAEIALPSRDYPELAESVGFFEALVERIQGMPGVSAASAITNLPLSGNQTATTFWALDRPVPEPGELPAADIRWIHRDYHETMGIPLMAGRLFDDQDHPEAPLTVIANRSLADELWPGDDPIGKTIAMPWQDTLIAEVVGVVGDVRHNGPDVEPRPKLYWHHVQWQARQHMSVVLRAEGDVRSLIGPLRAEVKAADPNLPVYNVRTMGALIDQTLAQKRFIMLTLGLFAIVALVLATVGVYGVISYSVSRRTREIGVRMAMGATSGKVALRVVRGGLGLALVAVVLGSLGALALGRVMQGLVFGVSTSDPLTLGLAALFLVLVAVAASYWPARRAARINPIEALRFD
jgi:putative ABC transport system permease protein